MIQRKKYPKATPPSAAIAIIINISKLIIKRTLALYVLQPYISSTTLGLFKEHKVN
jgi:hypothetical protein